MKTMLISLVALGFAACGREPASQVTAADGGSGDCQMAMFKCSDMGLPSADDVDEVDRYERNKKGLQTEREKAYEAYQKSLDADVKFNQALLKYLLDYPLGFSLDGTSDAPYGSSEYYQGYINKLGEFLKKERAKTPGQATPLIIRIAEEIASAKLKQANANGTELKLTAVEVQTVEGETNADGTTTNTTDNANATVGVNAGAQASMTYGHATSFGTSKVVTRKGKESEVRVKYTSKSRDPEIPDVEVDDKFLTGAESHVGLSSSSGTKADHNSADIGLQKAQTEAEKREAARAAQAAERAERRRKEIEEYNKQPDFEIWFQRSRVDGKYHRIDEEVFRAYSFLDTIWVDSLEASQAAARSTQKVLTQRFEELLAAQAKVGPAITAASAKVGASTFNASDATEVTTALDGVFNAACSQPSIAGLPELLERQLADIRAVGANFQAAVGKITALQPTDHMMPLWAAAEAEVAEQAELIAKVRAATIDTKQCDRVNALYHGVSMRLEKQIVDATTADLKKLLERVKADVDAAAAAKAEQAARQKAFPRAQALVQALKNAFVRNELFRAAAIEELINAEKARVTTAVEVEGLSADRKQAIASELTKLYDRALTEWSSYRDETTPRIIVLTRATDLSETLEAIRTGISAQGPAQQSNLVRIWQETLESVGIILHEDCFHPVLSLRPNCWKINVPAGFDEPTLREFDARLDSFTKALDTFKAAIIAPPGGNK